MRCRFQVLPTEAGNVRREYLHRMKRAFDERGIEIPYPHVRVVQTGGADQAPITPIRAAP